MNKFNLFITGILLSCSLHGQEIIHYWHFNTASGELGIVNADISNTPVTASLVYQKTDPDGDDIGIMDDVEGTTSNARFGIEAGSGIRPRNPSANGELHINMSTEGYENILFSYATQRSASGMLIQQLMYTTDGDNFVNFSDLVEVNEGYELQTFDLTSVVAANDNPLFAIKVRFLGQNTADIGNNRFDNIVLEGQSLTSQSAIHYWHFNAASGELDDVPADIHAGTEAPVLRYQKIDEGGDDIGIMDNVEGSVVNAKFGVVLGNGIRPRNPSANGELLIELNSTGFEDLRLSYATERSGSGMLQQQLLYTTDGLNYNTLGLPQDVADSYALMNYDFTSIAGVNNNPNFAVKIRFLGQNTAENGNNRLDNIALEGTALNSNVAGVGLNTNNLFMVVGESEQLTAVLIPSTASNQNLTWTSNDETIASVDQNGIVSAAGVGITSVNVTTLEGSFVATAQVTVVDEVSVEFIVSSAEGPIEGATVNFDGEVQITDANGSTIFERIPGIYELTVQAAGFISTNQNIGVAQDVTIPIVLEALSATLIHYWHFNALPGAEVEEVLADYSAIENVEPLIYYGFLPNYVEAPGVTVGYMDDYSPGSILNSQLGEPEGNALRVRNRSEGRTLIFEVPTTGFENIVLSFDVFRSGSGMLINHLEYSSDGVTWTPQGIFPQSIEISESFETKTFDFSDVDMANNNPNFMVRARFEGNTDQGNGNNRYDNVALFGNLITSTENTALPDDAFQVYPNPTAGPIAVQLKSKYFTTQASFTLYDMQGRLQKSGILSGESSQLDLSGFGNGAYILRISHQQMQGHKVLILNR